MLTSVHNDADDTDDADDADDYSRVIGIAQLKAYSCANNTNPMVIQTNNSKIKYFLPGPNKKNIAATKRIQRCFHRNQVLGWHIYIPGSTI